jgi:hypothetical protein
MPGEVIFMFVFIAGMIAGVIVIMMAMRQRSQQLEMQHRERMAMIERGQVPTDPPHIPFRLASSVGSRPTGAGSRSMSVGIVVTAFGLGLMTIIGIAAGAPDVGIGIGGAIVILGLAFVANSLVSRTYHGPDVPPPPRHEDIR